MVRLNNNEFMFLCNFMSKKYGINLRKKRVLIEYRLMNILASHHIDSYQVYIDKVFRDKSGKMEEELINKLTTNYTFFMREPSHFDFIEKNILVHADLNTPFYVWIAGCSSGQECYTMLMRLEDLKREGILLPDIKLIASDISTKVLEQAKEARYPIEAMEVFPETWKERYCEVDADQKTFTICDCLKKQVTFIHHNLMNTYRENSFHLIMCRNVLIYFDDISRAIIYDNFVHSLKSQGYLILGHTEIIPHGNAKFEYLKSSVYRLKE